MEDLSHRAGPNTKTKWKLMLAQYCEEYLEQDEDGKWEIKDDANIADDIDETFIHYATRIVYGRKQAAISGRPRNMNVQHQYVSSTNTIEEINEDGKIYTLKQDEPPVLDLSLIQGPLNKKKALFSFWFNINLNNNAACKAILGNAVQRYNAVSEAAAGGVDDADDNSFNDGELDSYSDAELPEALNNEFQRLAAIDVSLSQREAEETIDKLRADKVKSAQEIEAIQQELVEREEQATTQIEQANKLIEKLRKEKEESAVQTQQYRDKLNKHIAQTRGTQDKLNASQDKLNALINFTKRWTAAAEGELKDAGAAGAAAGARAAEELKPSRRIHLKF